MKTSTIIACLILAAAAVTGCQKGEAVKPARVPPMATAIKDTTPKNVLYPYHRQRPVNLISGN